MKVLEIVADKVITANPEDTASRGLKLMYENNASHLSLVDDNGNFLGMVYAKQFLTVNPMPSSKLKNFITKTPTLNVSDTIEKSVELFMTTGEHVLPVFRDGKFYSTISENDVILTWDFG